MSRRRRLAQQDRKSITPTALGVMLGAGLAVLVAFVAGSAAVRGLTPDEFWSGFYVNGQFERFDTLTDMVESSDLIVVGEVASVAESRRVVIDRERGEDGYTLFAGMTILDVTVIKSDGRVPADPLTVELFVPSPGNFPEMVARPPDERVLFFLQENPDPASELPFAVVAPNSSYIRDRLGRAAIPTRAEEAWLLELDRKPFGVVLDTVRAVVGSS